MKEPVTQPDENLAYHASRLLILIQECGAKGKTPGIKGRTLLAKLDFFLRYPHYLAKASEILSKPLPDTLRTAIESAIDKDSIESRMVRYRFGPWDHSYYPTLAYLIGKGLVQVSISTRTEVFGLTNKGQELSILLTKDQLFREWTDRAKAARFLFASFKGTRLKDFIYSEFPEVVSTPINVMI